MHALLLTKQEFHFKNKIPISCFMFTEWKWTYTLDVEDEVHIINMGVYGQAAFKNDLNLIFFYFT